MLENFEHLYFLYYQVVLLTSFYLLFLIVHSKTGLLSVMHTFLKGIYLIFIIMFFFESILLYGILNFKESHELLIQLFRISLIPKTLLSIYLCKFGISLNLNFHYEREINLIFILLILLISLFHIIQPIDKSLAPFTINFYNIGYLIASISIFLDLLGGLLIFKERKKFKNLKKVIVRLAIVGLFYWVYEVIECIFLYNGLTKINLNFSTNLISRIMYILAPLFLLAFSFFIYRIFNNRTNRVIPDIRVDMNLQLGYLTEREQEVLSYILRGYSNDKIQDRLYIAKSTLKTHINKIFSKCGVKNRLELIYLLIDKDSINEQVLKEKT